MKISITTILWGKVKTIEEFKTILSNVKKIGFDGIGLETRYLPNELLKKPELVPQFVDDLGLELVGSYSTMKLSDVKYAARAKTPLLWVVVRKEKTYAQALRTLKKFAKLAVGSSVVPAVHNHLHTCFETEDEVVRALEDVDGIKLCFDTAHAEAARIDSTSFIRKYHKKIALVHLKDLRVRAPKNKISFLRDFVNVGRGIIDFGSVIGVLSEVGYRGHLMLEIDSAKGKKASPEELAGNGYRRVMDLLSDRRGAVPGQSRKRSLSQ